MNDDNNSRNLLISLIALQLNFINGDQLCLALAEWAKDKSRSIESILVCNKAIDESTAELLLSIADKQQQQNNHDATHSIANLSAIDSSLLQSLASLSDPALDQTLSAVQGLRSATVRVDSDKNASKFERDSTTGRFTILRSHAKGGLGEVYVAYDRELNREVAVKEIQDKYAFDEDSRSRFLLEAEITGGLEHPGIVPVYGLGTYADGRPFYAMRFIKGSSLTEAASKFHETCPLTSDSFRGVDFRNLLRRFVDVCFSIEYAHSRGVLHRDLKPGNIMLGKYGETLVVDWGLAKSVSRSGESPEFQDEGTLHPSSGSGSSHTMMGRALGTLAYMSPEAAAGRLELLGVASDVYGLGATLYYVLTGRPPYQKSDIEAVKKCQFLSPQKVLSVVPKALEAVCLKAMALEPQHRYSSAKRLAEEIELWLADEPVAAYADPLSMRLSRFARKHRTLVTTASIAATAGLILLSIFTWILATKNRELRLAYELAERNRQFAETQESAARNNAITARDAVMNITRVAENNLASMTGMENIREAMMDKALTLFGDLHRQHSDDPAITTDLAKVLRLSSNVKRNKRNLLESGKLLERSIALQLQLDDPSREARRYLAESFREELSLAKATGNIEKGVQSLEKAVAILDEQFHMTPEDIELKKTLATIDLERVGLFISLANSKEALAAAQRSDQRFLEIIDAGKHTENEYITSLMATSRHAQALAKLGRTEEAMEIYAAGMNRGRSWMELSTQVSVRFAFARLLLYQAADQSELEPAPAEATDLIIEAIERLENLVKISPTTSHRSALGSSYRIKGIIETRNGKFELGRGALEKSLEVLQTLVRDVGTGDYMDVLAMSQYQFAKYFLAIEEKSQAMDWFEKSIDSQNQALARSPSSIEYRNDLTTYRGALEAAKH